MRSDDIDSTIAALTGVGGLRVWSLLVSVFGDLAREKGAGIAGPVLSEIMTSMDVRPEATRVALHRLRNDNWISSVKTGRTSRHSLTDQGRKQTLAASARIYANPARTETFWQVILTHSDDTPLQTSQSVVRVAPRIWIGPRNASVPETAAVLCGKALPEWIKETTAPAKLRKEYATLYDILKPIDAAVPAQPDLSPLDRAVLRCLIVHNWRRLVLKHPDLPRDVYPDDWRGHDCHAIVYGLLSRLPPPDPAELAG